MLFPIISAKWSHLFLMYKSSIMKKFKFILLIIIVSNTLFAQEFNFYPPMSKKYKVLAVSGLNLRAKPNVKSDIVKKIAYNDIVRLEHKDAYGSEKLDSMTTISGSTYYSQGFWIKVRHGKSLGFLNTAYLYPVYPEYRIADEEFYDALNKDFVLLMPGYGCRDNLVEDYHGFHWYGYYKRDGKSYLKKVAFEYFRMDGEMADMSIAVKEDEGLKFIVGTKVEFLEQEIKSIHFNKNFHESAAPSDTLEKISYSDLHCEVHAKGHLRKLPTRDGERDYRYWTYKFYACHENEKQLLVEGAFVNWVGDLDQDGFMDYIITRGEKDARTILYLSSHRKENQIVAPVACFYSGYCC